MQKILPLVLRPQQTEMWCWAASAQMCMEFIGNTTVAQCRQASNEFGVQGCCNSPTPIPCVDGGWPEFPKYGFTSLRTQDAGLSWEELVGEIDANRPIAFSWHWLVDGADAGGHMMVAHGYSEVAGARLVHVADPWAPNVGDQYTISYDVYLAAPGHRHWDDFYEIRQAPSGREFAATGGRIMTIPEIPDTRDIAKQYLPTVSEVAHSGPGSADAPLEVEAGIPAYKMSVSAVERFVESGGTNLPELPHEILHPISRAGRLQSSISLFRNTEDVWALSSTNRRGLARLIEGVGGTRDASSLRRLLFDMRPLGLMFLVFERDGEPHFASLADSTRLDLRAGEEISATSLLPRLRDLEERSNNLPA
jgi:hypothetical protein